MKQTIGIIGMGVSGLAVLLALSRLSATELAQMQIFCFDDAEHFGRGIPFQQDDASALINSPIDAISFDYQQMADFTAWLTAHQLDTKDSYVARALYGRYMTERAQQLIQSLPVTVITQQVQDLHYLPDIGVWQLRLDNGPFEPLFDVIHLACGALPVMDPYGLAGLPNYISDPYPIQGLAKLDWQETRVAVIGTGLAAVDVIKWLLLNTSAHIRAFSRSNFLPTVRILKSQAIHWQFLTDKALKQLLHQGQTCFDLASFEALLEKELEALGFADWQSATRQYLARGIAGLLLSLENAEPLDGLQQVANRVVDWLTDLWPLMSLSDRKIYQKTYHKAIVNLRNPMPEPSAHVILTGASHNQLQMLESVTTIQQAGKGFSLRTRKGQTLYVDRIINATGYQLNEKNLKRASPLLQSLIDQQLVQIDSTQGLSVLAATAQVISPKYGLTPNLYAHGALINGVIYQNNSTIKIQKIAERAVQSAHSKQYRKKA
ncbi:FAD/NAD(P)-binding protein [Streptococcus halichoeri]|uniref:FAD/NAD(P)-binding protein n=1 Tax=Streptococcus halichoeri TaxID=254785 RepID=UPI001C8DDFBE|nr:FAD/NAD(P)-binding protein [Streptococcus halichoeri]